MNDLRKIVCRETGDVSYRFIADCGMEVHMIESPFLTTYAALGARYGAFDLSYDNKSIVPGTAHFLEHKMFDMADGGDAFDLFASYGISANAFTSHEYTTYLFSTTAHEKKALEILVDFICHPHITEETVKKEVGIIEQEIASYQDDPFYRAYMAALSLMYHHHPIRHDIAGTRQSIKQIHAEDLRSIYHYFYRPDNMILAIAGCKLKAEEVEEIIDRAWGKEPPRESIDRILPSYDEEESDVHQAVLYMDVSTPRVVMTFKNTMLNEGHRTAEGYCLDIVAACLFGRTSRLYRELFATGGISRDFEGYYEWSWGVGHLVLSFDASDPQAVIDHITEYLLHINEHFPAEAEFEAMKMVAYADVITAFDQVSDIALSDLEESMCGGDHYLLPEMIKSITYDDFCSSIKSIFKEKPYIVYILQNSNKGEIK